MRWWLYILHCGNGDLYTGITTQVERRLREHQGGTGGQFTRSHRPVRLIYREALRSEGAARRREAEIKAWPRKKKLELVAGNRNALRSA